MFGLISGGLSLIGGAFQAIQGAKQASDAKNALMELKVPELKNVTEGLQVSTMGNDLKVENAGNRFAQNVDTLRSGGIRGVIGGLSSVNAQAKQTDLEVAADYEKQQNDIAQMAVEDDARIRAMQEQRYQNNVAALSSQVNAGQQSMMQGISGALQGVSSGIQMDQSSKQFDKMLGSNNSDAYKSYFKSQLNPFGK
ncbi:hypothetical protein [Flavobacterium sp.]|uniref:hypothetical protein n=1 Tax=Flavobacterium sp. TaxID=239 RepID=UPI0025FA4198|nr:hypothetical protein [Flavobacterium sp.]